MEFILKRFLQPALRRLGTLTAGYLSAKGVPEDDVQAIYTGLVIGGAVLFDLFLSALNKEGR